jgi:hypothetical protein
MGIIAGTVFRYDVFHPLFLFQEWLSDLPTESRDIP